MANETTTLIQKVTVGAASASTITFSNIPQSYTDLQILCTTRATDASNAGSRGLNLNFNGVSTNRSGRWLYAAGASTGSATTSTLIAAIGGTSVTANTFASASIYIPNYTSSTNKPFSVENVTENNSSSAYELDMLSGLWSSTAAITSITLYPDSPTSFAQYSTFYLYGIVKQGVTPAATSSPYATGGDDITFDGTNWIHTFRSTGTFTPNRALSNVDYLVVAGGGGYPGAAAGGGGAGGLRCTVGATGGGGSLESKLSLSAQAYTVTVGAGGSTGAGSNSVFGSVTATGGGAPGLNAGNGGTGGSGGGGGYGASTTGGAGTANQGYAGGTGVGTSTDRGGGGGGGAGAVGGNGNATGGIPGNGGAGVTTSISGTSTTYAGGGGGGGYGTSGGTGGSGGGGNGSRQSQNATDGTANTGGGGGGSYYSAGGNGGSGIVIVRYSA